MGYANLIRINKQKDRLRALETFFSVRETYHRFPGNKFLVSNAHIEALRERGVPFEDITDPASEDGEKKASKSRRGSSA